MKRKIFCFTAAVFAAASLAACGDKDDFSGGDFTVAVYMPDGAPALALAALMDSGYEHTEFTVVSASAIGARVSNGDADMAVMPINAAATLYNMGSEITMLSVNTHGNLYVVGKSDESIDLGGLIGKRVGIIGQGNVPDLTLRMMMDKSEISYSVSDAAVAGSVALRYGADGPAVLQLLNQGMIDYAFLAEPAATTATQNFGAHIVTDAQEEWEELFDCGYPQACLVAKTSLVEAQPEYIEGFLAALKESDGWAEQNPSLAYNAISAHMEGSSATTLTLSALTPDAIRRCNIKTVYAADGIEECAAYFEQLTMLDTGLPGGAKVLSEVPNSGFYYKSK